MQCKISLNFWAVPVLFLKTVVSTLDISNDSRKPDHSQACTVVLPCVGVVSQKFLGGEFLTDARSFGSAASHLRISGADLPQVNERGLVFAIIHLQSYAVRAIELLQSGETICPKRLESCNGLGQNLDAR